jgi:beta-lactamase regulating signal transducer with metallopeptidase domain
MISAMVEAALRSLLLALVVGAGLRAFRVRNVLAQKAAWGLVLAASLAMPFLVPLAGQWQVLPSNAIVNLPAHPLGLLMSQLSRLDSSQGATPVAQIPRESVAPMATEHRSATMAERSITPEPISIPASGSFASVTSIVYQGSPEGTVPQQPIKSHYFVSLTDLAWLAYLSVAATLVFRLIFGLASAILLWMGAEPIVLKNEPGLAEGLALRSSREVASPVTIGSAVVLPVDYADWDAEKLRIVLAHERSHIRQHDFYLQFLAGLYSAVIWFSPLGWWLKSKLSDLAETISDRAGLEQAADCSSYAQILLEFAAAPRPTLTGVAMARSGSLSRRIEHLLNDSSFRQAFAGGRGRVMIAVVLVPIAFFAATALIRVQAAQQQPAPAASPAPASQAQPPAKPSPSKPAEAPVTGQANPAEPDVDTTAEPAPEPLAPPAPVIAPSAPAPVAPVAELGDRIIVVPRISRAPRVVVVPSIPPMTIRVPSIQPMTIRIPDTTHVMALVRQAAIANGNGYYYSTDDGQSYGIVRSNGQMQFSGDLHTADIDKIRKMAHGDFLWFRRDGKYYFVDDAATMSQIEAMYKPIEDLGKQQEELGRKQEELGKQQEALGRQQEQASLPTPDMTKEMAEINAAMAKLQAKMGKTITQDELSDLMSKLGDLQGRLGDLQGKVGDKQGELGEQQGKLGEEQGKLGAEQGRLGAQQGILGAQADRKVRSIIDQSMQNGKAHPVE